jgi:transcriptional regulator of acetoin/glycerol metabolism
VARELLANPTALEAGFKAVRAERRRLNAEGMPALAPDTQCALLRLVAEEAVAPLGGTHATAMAARSLEGRAAGGEAGGEAA